MNQDQFYNAIKENVAQQQLSLDSSDSLSLGDNIRGGYDFHLKSVSLEKESGTKTKNETDLLRDESFDSFHPVRFRRCCTYILAMLTQEYISNSF